MEEGGGCGKREVGVGRGCVCEGVKVWEGRDKKFSKCRYM